MGVKRRHPKPTQRHPAAPHRTPYAAPTGPPTTARYVPSRRAPNASQRQGRASCGLPGSRYALLSALRGP